MLLVVRTIIWSSSFFLLRGYPNMLPQPRMELAERSHEPMNIPIWAGIVDGAKLF